ncbi:hypothetical protein [Escherichia coli]|uniref:hypothetical protein n=1 Tax=Escherichia coli TaxID=562 RepID=UPI0035A33CFC
MSITQPEPATAQPDETVSEADAEANKAIEYLNNVMDIQSTDMAEIRNARGNVREAIAALQAAGRFEENEELVNGAARHLARPVGSNPESGGSWHDTISY